MLVINAAQLVAFERTSRLAFVDEMTAHLRSRIPRPCDRLEAPTLRSAVQQLVARAEGHGLVSQGGIRLYLELAAMLGAGFDDDPQYPWARETLRYERFPNEMYKAGRLETLARRCLRQLRGPRDSDPQTIREPLERWASAPPSADVNSTFAALAPRRLAYIGTAAASELLHRAAATVTRLHGADDPHTAAAIAVLFFCFGAGCEQDPLLPWIGDALGEGAVRGPAPTVAEIQRGLLHWLADRPR